MKANKPLYYDSDTKKYYDPHTRTINLMESCLFAMFLLGVGIVIVVLAGTGIIWGLVRWLT